VAKIKISESELKTIVLRLMEIEDVESDIADLTDRTDNISDVLDDDTGRVGYIRQLTAELLEYLQTLNTELDDQVDIPISNELMNKIMGRTERKRYYMSKFRL
tara:strand:- start:785 stop:1093 length:309 start_codon:yes stop_codon:yes gene_type:complete